MTANVDYVKPSKVLNPSQLVDEFKKSGEFDRLRRQLLAQFQNGASMDSINDLVQKVTSERLASGAGLQRKSRDAIYADLIQEIERFPVVEKAVAEHLKLSNPTFGSNIRKSITRILKANGSAEMEVENHDAEPRQPTSAERTDVQMNGVDEQKRAPRHQVPNRAIAPTQNSESGGKPDQTSPPPDNRRSQLTTEHHEPDNEKDRSTTIEESDSHVDAQKDANEQNAGDRMDIDKCS